MKFTERLRMVQFAAEHGVKPAAREFGCQPRIARKWLRRWRAGNRSRASLMDRSRAPKSCPHKTPAKVEELIVRERLKAPCLGPVRLREFRAIPAGKGAIARILRQRGLATKRRKKYEKKRDMRAMKAKWAAFERPQADVKYLDDIPFYAEQLLDNPALPRFEYTFRDPKTGGTLLGFASELSESHAAVFAAAVGGHLARTGFDLRGRATVQTDNGGEFSGAEKNTPKDRGFTHVVERVLGAAHKFIPPGRKNLQADVESFHNSIEVEFLDLERHASRQHFLANATLYQLWWNTTRKIMHKGGRTPDQILLEEKPARDPRVWLLPALDLDLLLDIRTRAAARAEKPRRGYHVPGLPGHPPAAGRGGAT